MRSSKVKPLIIWGAGTHGRVVAESAKASGRFKILGFLDSINPQAKGTRISGIEILGGEEKLEWIKKKRIGVVVAIGDCEIRLKLGEKLRRRGIALETVIHPTAVIASDISIGEGSVLAAGAIVQPGTQIGRNVILNNASSIECDCRIEDGVHISPGVRVGEKSTVGKASWIALGAVVFDKIKIGSRSIVGAGSLVTKTIPDSVVAYGSPARVVRRR